MASPRRRLVLSFSRLPRKAAIPFTTHPLLIDRDADNRPPPPPLRPISPGGRSPFILRFHTQFGPPSRDLRSLGFFSTSLAEIGHRRSYVSAPGGSNDAEIIKDVAEVITEVSMDASAASGSAAAVPASVAGEVAAAAADSSLPIAVLQHVIDGVHSFTGLNWWAAIALTTVLIRGATFPHLIKQMKANVKLNELRPEMEKLNEQRQNSMSPESLEEAEQKMFAFIRKHGVTLFIPLTGVFIQGLLFIYFYLAISNMVEKVPSFKVGGAFWFTDLTTPDPMYILPVLTSATFLLTVELNMQGGMKGNPVFNRKKKISRMLGLLTIPFTAGFPKAIFFYLVTSNLFSLTFAFVKKRPAVRKYFTRDIVPQPASARPRSSFSGMPKAVQPAASPVSLSGSDNDPPKSAERKISSLSILSQRIRNLEKSVRRINKLKRSERSPTMRGKCVPK